MDKGSEFKDDHDALITLISEFRSFSKHITDEVRDLKDNTIGRLNKIETDMYSPSGIVDNVKKDVEGLKRSNGRYLLMISIYSAIGATMIALITYHIFKQ